MSQYGFLFALLALLVGVGVGKAWERYKLRDGRWIDRRRLRQTPHYMLGLNFLVDHHVDQAVDELTQAVSTDGDALEIQMILGNLLRQKGQVARAITLHQSLLQRPDLTPIEHAYVLLCLGLDYRHGGFVDRALEAFREVVQLDPRNRYALVNLQRLHEDQQEWSKAAEVRQAIQRLDKTDQPENRQILAFLRNQIGRAFLQAGAVKEAAATFTEAIETDATTAPAYLNLGDVRAADGDAAGAIAAWEQLTRAVPERAHLAFARLERAYASAGDSGRFVSLCQRLIAQRPYDWRARLALSRHVSAAGHHGAALDLLFDALPHHPHALIIHQEVWRVLGALDFNPVLVGRYTDLTRGAVFYLDPHVCTTCRYRSTELLWQCPQCHDWDTFIEERITPARGLADSVATE
jgi:lipopolysaccharide assembly protein B